MDHQQKTPAKSRNTILNFLPRPTTTSSVSFQNPLIYSPAKDNKPNKSHLGIAFSGPLITGDNTRRKIKNDAVVYEPTSPRVSCMGQVKCKYTKDKLRLAGNKLPAAGIPAAGKIFRLTSPAPESSKTENKSKKMLGVMKFFSGVITPGCGGRRMAEAGKINGTAKAPLYIDKAPSLSMMKRFSSGRDKLSDIDWVKEGVDVDSGDRNYDSDEESDDGDVIVPSSAPVMIRNPLGFDDKFVRVVGNMQPRKEINLWKRRTMPQPKPLKLNNI